ncbi:MAG: SIS domain-containing protein [Candidatus Omnitrophica bacterium]|nr:Phosphoheptose isomerase 1 [bacterium]NUN95086.1 SIS domain-containing protein [Candidatus Omnitrophota bacterium]
MSSAPTLESLIEASKKSLDSLKSIEGTVTAAAKATADRLAAGSKILIAGNGGSCSQAMHFAGEIIGRFRNNRRPYPAIALGTDTASTTCILNDFGADVLFARQVEGLGQPGDVFIGLTTSGTSPNVVAALKAARERGLITIGWLGRDGGTAKDLCDYAIIVPGTDTGRIQEAHLLILHYFAEWVEALG